LRRQPAAAASSPGHPAATAKFPPIVLVVSVGANQVLMPGVLITMARWNRPLASGDSTLAMTACEPVDSPAMVTFCGSPPKAAMLRRTQRSASCWSSSQ
jgi:hypothetical protein